MRSIWSCSSCVVLLLSALFRSETSASYAGSHRKDVLHRIAKAQVTAHPAHPARRDEGTCPTGYDLCPASLGGGCCPHSYDCASDVCHAATASPTTACGYSGYYPCPAEENGGCCPVGYICTNGDCLPPAGSSISEYQCLDGYSLCPSSLNYGCCRSGMGCGFRTCYSTEPVTSTVIQTITTTSDDEIITTTTTAVTVVTPTPPPETTGEWDMGWVAKYIPTAVPKLPASGSSNESDGGLSGGALGGIIAGVVVLLIVVVIAAFLIIRRLRHVEEVMESKKGSSSGKKSKSRSQAQVEHYGRQLHSPADIDDMSIDPLMVASNASTSAAATPQPGAHGASRGRSDSAGLSPSPNIFHRHGGGMMAAADDRSRHASPDSNPGYFDVPVHGQNVAGGGQQPMMPARMRSNTESSAHSGQQYGGYAYHHWRQQSNASELSAEGSDHGANARSPLVLPELDGSAGFVELPSAVEGGRYGARSRSSSTTSGGGGGGGGGGGWYGVGGHARNRSDGRTPGVDGGPGPAVTGVGAGLAPLDEAAENMHGYYGRRNQQAGQTAAGLDVGWDVSSPVAPGFQNPLPPPSPGRS
ncbi:Mid2 domain-containing protein [Madurella fahalii]|uniref:Mid2 domain-containing protein n=1 Tax=Madurella fahalii TaxID=1157608 RepID=A0ABQ0G573_9PEZI